MKKQDTAWLQTSLGGRDKVQRSVVLAADRWIAKGRTLALAVFLQRMLMLRDPVAWLEHHLPFSLKAEDLTVMRTPQTGLESGGQGQHSPWICIDFWCEFATEYELWVAAA